MAPPPAEIMCGSAAWQRWKIASTLIAKERRQSSGVRSSSEPRRFLPALLHSTSMAPSVAMTLSMMARQPSGREMSEAKARVAPPISFAAASTPSASTSVRTTRAPSEAKRRAMAAPMPPAAPVTMTALSWKRMGYLR